MINIVTKTKEKMTRSHDCYFMLLRHMTLCSRGETDALVLLANDEWCKLNAGSSLSCSDLEST